MEVICSYEIMVDFYQNGQHYISEDRTFLLKCVLSQEKIFTHLRKIIANITNLTFSTETCEGG
jgi:hypothetical protein